MRKQIRQGVFETNSSSTHSLVIAKQADKLQPILPDNEGVLTIKPETLEFGWGTEWVRDFDSKACYLYLDAQEEEYLDMLAKVIRDFTGAETIIWPDSVIAERKGDYRGYDIYIDHQSMGTSSEVFNISEDYVRQFLFHPLSAVILDNDNTVFDQHIKPYQDKQYQNIPFDWTKSEQYRNNQGEWVMTEDEFCGNYYC